MHAGAQAGSVLRLLTPGARVRGLRGAVCPLSGSARVRLMDGWVSLRSRSGMLLLTRVHEDSAAAGAEDGAATAGRGGGEGEAPRLESLGMGGAGDLAGRGRELACAPLVLRGHRGVVRSIAFAPHGRTLASGSELGC